MQRPTVAIRTRLRWRNQRKPREIRARRRTPHATRQNLKRHGQQQRPTLLRWKRLRGMRKRIVRPRTLLPWKRVRGVPRLTVQLTARQLVLLLNHTQRLRHEQSRGRHLPKQKRGPLLQKASLEPRLNPNHHLHGQSHERPRLKRNRELKLVLLPRKNRKRRRTQQLPRPAPSLILLR
jgi:hypothetical protein